VDAWFVVADAEAVGERGHEPDVGEFPVQQGRFDVYRDGGRVGAGGGPQSQKLFWPL
jgi:hypothetical protein